ncbi:hypothetical protein RJT34_20491 [Clitoria ternatea]|uniref:Uncharacterized protein n=1 Tax=Clitoria ternatea TaxID=43366 RepID=A0AAN9IT02_CLITE
MDREVGDYFLERFREEACIRLDGVDFNAFSKEDNFRLVFRFTLDEIKSTVWVCERNKYPSLDGFNFKFIRKGWEFMKEDLDPLAEKLMGLIRKDEQIRLFIGIYVCQTVQKEGAAGSRESHVLNMVKSPHGWSCITLPKVALELKSILLAPKADDKERKDAFANESTSSQSLRKACYESSEKQTLN